MAILRGPAKVDLIFVHEAHEPATAWQPGAVTLPSIDTHFWDWMLWLSSKEAAGKDDLVDGELTKLFEYILHPLGVEDRPMSVVGAVESYRHARGAAEKRFRRRVPRDLEDEVFPALELQRA